ncbi:TolC family protein [Rudanella lutea]|uniref:TolC family protein n=1 Tax=Rudanella lutea TaxID=451374 RepID=UPI00037570B0|nr:TolC family protein [Rudanella lutea]
MRYCSFLVCFFLSFQVLAQQPTRPTTTTQPQTDTPTSPVQRALQRTVTLANLPQKGSLLSLSEVVSSAVANNYQIRVNRSQELIAQNNNTKGFAGFYPTVNFTFQNNLLVQNLRQDFFNFNVPPQRLYGVVNRNATVGPAATYTVFNGFGREATLARLGQLVRVAEVNTRANIELTIADATTAYYDVVRQLQRLIAFQQALDISRERLELARATYEVGTRSKVDFLSAQVDYNADSAALMTQQLNLRNAKVVLNTLLVRELDTEFAVRDTILVRSDLSLPDLRESLKQQNPQLAAAVLNQRLAAIDVRLARAQQYPQVDLLGGYSFLPTDNQAGFGTRRGRNETYSLGIRMVLPLYNGGNLKRQLANARINEQITADQTANQQLQLMSALEQSYQQYRNSLAQLQLEVQNYQIALQNVDIAYDRYRIGNSTFVEFRDVQRNALTAQTRLIDASFNAKSAEIELLRLSSTITK